MTEQYAFCRNPRTGMNIAYVTRGEGPLVIFVHGFPDTYRGFLPILDRVAASGYQAVAPALRGYFPSDLAPDRDYRVEASARDVLDLAEALGAQQFSVVGHDWGAVTAYAVANLAPARVRRLVTAAVPHTGHFLLNMRPRQLRRSLYMLFVVPAAAAQHRQSLVAAPDLLAGRSADHHHLRPAGRLHRAGDVCRPGAPLPRRPEADCAAGRRPLHAVGAAGILRAPGARRA